MAEPKAKPKEPDLDADTYFEADDYLRAQRYQEELVKALQDESRAQAVANASPISTDASGTAAPIGMTPAPEGYVQTAGGFPLPISHQAVQNFEENAGTLKQHLRGHEGGVAQRLGGMADFLKEHPGAEYLFGPLSGFLPHRTEPDSYVSAVANHLAEERGRPPTAFENTQTGVQYGGAPGAPAEGVTEAAQGTGATTPAAPGEKPPVFIQPGVAANDNAKPKAAVGGGGGSSSASLKVSGGVAPTEGGPDFDQPYMTQSAALGAKADAEARLADAEGKAGEKQMSALDNAQAQMDRISADAKKFEDAHMARLEQLSKEAAEGTIDPEHFWHSKSTGQQILMALGAALGGAGAVYGHVPNFAMQHIEHAIDNDIEAQKENLLQKHRSVENERGLLAESYRRTQNMQQAVMLAKDVAMAHVDAELKSLSAGAKGDLAKSQALFLQGQLDEARQDRLEKQREFNLKLAQQLALARMRHSGAGSGTNLKRVQAIGKQIEQHGVLRVLKSIDETESGIAATRGEGLNWLSSHFGWDPRSGARSNLANISELEDVYTKTFGKLSKANAERVHRLMASGSEADVKHALQLMKHDAEGQLQSLRAQDPAAFDEYMANFAGGGGSFGGGGEADDPNVMPIEGEEP